MEQPPKPFQVSTQYIYDKKWRAAGDHTGVDSLEEAHKLGPQLVESHRTPLCGGVCTLGADSGIPRRYVVRTVLFVSEPL